MGQHQCGERDTNGAPNEVHPAVWAPFALVGEGPEPACAEAILYLLADERRRSTDVGHCS